MNAQLRDEFDDLIEAAREDAIRICSPTPGGRPRDPDHALQARIDAFSAALAAPGDGAELIVRLQHYVDHIGDMQDGFAGGDPQAVRDALDALLRARLAAPSKEAGPSGDVPTRFIDGMGWVVACKDAVRFVRDLAANPPGDQRQEGEWGFCCYGGPARKRACWSCAAWKPAASPPPEAAAAVGEEHSDDVILPRPLYEKILATGVGWQQRAVEAETKLAALASPTGVDEVRIPKSDRLDPITVYIADEGGGRGRMTIVCYNEAWTCYWGAMGNRTLREFVADCDAGYVAMNMVSGRNLSDHEHDYAVRIAAAVIAALAARDGGA